MTGRAFVAVLRKDWRVYRLPVVATVVVGALPYAMRVVVNGKVLSSIVADGLDVSKGNRDALAWAVDEAAFLSLGLTAITAAAFGGTAFAAERRDRSADFLATLPPGRGSAVVSKATVAAACLTVAFAVHVGIEAWADRILDADLLQGRHDTVGFLVRPIGAGLVMGFGVAWCLSAVLRSPAVSATAAVATVGATAVGLREAGLLDGKAGDLWNGVAVAAGVATFVGGSVCFVRRGEP